MNKIFCGDNRLILKELNLDRDKCIFVSDPPFNIGHPYKTYKDKMSQEDYYNWMNDLFGGGKSVMIHYPESIYEYAVRFNRVPEKVVSWVYNSMNPRQHRDIAYFDVKPDFRKVGQPYKNPNDKRIKKKIAEGKTARLYDWWNIDIVKNVSKEKTAHLAQMPFEVMHKAVGILPEGYTIVDPFMGSGTTILAAIAHDMDYVGIEMDEEYFNISKDRIRKASEGKEWTF